MLEAMACGALVIGSDTAPVREVLRDGHNGLIVPFFDAGAIAAKVCEALTQPNKLAALRHHAMLTAHEYSREDGIAGYDALLPAGADLTRAMRSPAHQVLQ